MLNCAFVHPMLLSPGSPSSWSSTVTWMTGISMATHVQEEQGTLCPRLGLLKECQKPINISDLGVCWGQAVSTQCLLCLLSQENRCSRTMENFASKIAFSILLLLEACSERNSHVITHHGYWKLLKLIHWDICCLGGRRKRRRRGCGGLKVVSGN